MRADRRDPTIAKLRRFKPDRFKATMRDGTERELALSTKANKWELLSETLDALPWSSVMALNGAGDVLGIVENDDIDEEELLDGGDTVDQVARLADVMLKVMVSTQKETREMVADVLAQQSEMGRTMLESSRAINESYTMALQVQRAQLAAQGGGEEPDKIMEMLKMGMMLKMGGSPSINVGVSPPPPKATVPPTKKKA